MSTLLPLVESSSSERARQLLRAARADGPRAGAAGRALSALGVVGSAATAATAAAASGGSQLAAGLVTSSASLPMIAAKWLLVGTLSGLALASGASAVFSSHETKPAELERPSAPRESALTRASNNARAEADATTAVATEAPTVVKAAKPSTPPVTSSESAPSPQPFAAPSQAAFASPEQSKLLRDVALLDDARHALKAGDTSQALTLITRYDTERQTHILDREAELLRIDVLVARGERSRARTLAQAYLAAFPSDAHKERLRALVSDHK